MARQSEKVSNNNQSQNQRAQEKEKRKVSTDEQDRHPEGDAEKRKSILTSLSSAVMQLLKALALVVALALFLVFAAVWLILDFFLAHLSVEALSLVSNLFIFVLYIASPHESLKSVLTRDVVSYSCATSLADVPVSMLVVTALVFLSLRVYGRELQLHKDQVFYDAERGGLQGMLPSSRWRRPLPFLLILLANLIFLTTKLAILEHSEEREKSMVEFIVVAELLLGSALCLRAAKVWRPAFAERYVEAEVALLASEGLRSFRVLQCAGLHTVHVPKRGSSASQRGQRGASGEEQGQGGGSRGPGAEFSRRVGSGRDKPSERIGAEGAEGQRGGAKEAGEAGAGWEEGEAGAEGRRAEGEEEEPPLVLMPGFGACGAFYAPCLPGLAGKWEVLAVDWLGTGGSERPGFRFGGEEAEAAERWFVERLEAWRAEMGIERMRLLGHSLGGILVAAYALRYPHRVAALCLASPATPKRRDLSALPAWFRVVRWLWEGGATPQALFRLAGPLGPSLARRGALRRFLRDRESADPPTDLRLLARMLYHSWAGRASGERALNAVLQVGGSARLPLEDRLPGRLRVPTTILYGGGADWMDPNVGREIAAAMTREGNKVDVHLVGKGGHQLFLDDAPAFVEAVLAAFGEREEHNDDQIAAEDVSLAG